MSFEALHDLEDETVFKEIEERQFLNDHFDWTSLTHGIFFMGKRSES